MTAVVAYLLLTLAAAATVCGHQGQPWPLPSACRAVRGVWARTRGRAGAGTPYSATPALRDTETPTTPHTPTWARTEQDAA